MEHIESDGCQKQAAGSDFAPVSEQGDVLAQQNIIHVTEPHRCLHTQEHGRKGSESEKLAKSEEAEGNPLQTAGKLSGPVHGDRKEEVALWRPPCH